MPYASAWTARLFFDSGSREALSTRILFGHKARMASDPKTVAYIVDQASGAGDVRAKPMFGEYGIYCDDRMVAMVCDDQLFVKPTPSGRSFAPDASEAQPYLGAKPCLLIDIGHWDDRDWLGDLFRVTAAALPPPKPKVDRKRLVLRGG